MKNPITAATIACGLALLSAHASSLPFPQTTDVTVTRTGDSATNLPGGDWLAGITEQATNTGPVTLYNVYWILTDFYFEDPTTSLFHAAVWDNSAQEWTYDAPTMPNAAAWAANAAANVLLLPTNTDIPYQASLSGDTLPAFLIATQLAPGQSASFTWEEVVQGDASGFAFPDHPIIGSAAVAPEPSTAAMMFACGGMLIAFGRLRPRPRR